MTSYYYLLMIAVIILSTRLLGGLSERVNMPQVVGALIAGVILGPSVLGWVEETDFLAKTAEIGVILLMFIAGLDTNISEIKKNKVSLVAVSYTHLDVYKRQVQNYPCRHHVLVQESIDLAHAQASHQHSLYMVKKSAVFCMMVL